MSHEIAEGIWKKTGTVLYTIDGNDYLIVVDYFSNFWDHLIDHLIDTKASTVIRKLKCHFARQGVPQVVISDNGLQFACKQFTFFANQWGFEHRPGSPGRQQTNGKAEAAVKQAKRLLRRSKETKGDLHLALLAMRNTPTESMGTSPPQRLLGRRCRTLLPTTKGLLKPQTVPTEEVKKKTQASQARQANYYNQGAKDLSSLEEGDVVRMRPFRLEQKTWEKATVVKRYDKQSCEVETDTGSYCQNRVDLKQQQPIPQKSTVISEPAPDTIMNQDPTTAKPNNEVKTSQSTSQPQELHQDSPSTVSQRPKSTSRSPAYLKDCVH